MFYALEQVVLMLPAYLQSRVEKLLSFKSRFGIGSQCKNKRRA
jgi:hypothetical protein